MNKTDSVAQSMPEHIEEPQKPWTNVEPKGADRAAELMGDQQIEVTEEDVSLRARGTTRSSKADSCATIRINASAERPTSIS